MTLNDQYLGVFHRPLFKKREISSQMVSKEWLPKEL